MGVGVPLKTNQVGSPRVSKANTTLDIPTTRHSAWRVVTMISRVISLKYAPFAKITASSERYDDMARKIRKNCSGEK